MSEIHKLDTDLASEDISTLVFHLVNDKLFLPDLMRDYKILIDSLSSAFEVWPKPFGIYDNEKLVGCVLMTDIVPEHQARLLVWLWAKSAATAKTIRWLKDYLDYMKNQYALKRIMAQSSCKKLSRILRMLGFADEGRFRYGMKWGGKLHTLVQFRRIMED